MRTRVLAAVIAVTAALSVSAQSHAAEPLQSLVPVPVSVQARSGVTHTLTAATKIYTAPAARDVGTFLAGVLRPSTGYALPAYASLADNPIVAGDENSARGMEIALTDTGFYPIPKSRFSSLVGIDYALYEELRDLTFGFGPVAGTEKTPVSRSAW